VLVAHLLYLYPKYRITAKEALETPFFEDLTITRTEVKPMTSKEAASFHDVQHMRPPPPLMYERCVSKRYKVDQSEALKEKLMAVLGELTAVSL
jgi:hypothetical protein